MEVIYCDNHIVVVNKAPGEIVQGDKTGDRPLVKDVKAWIKETYAKPGNVFCGVVHRLDRPVGGLVVFARTSKGLARMNELFRDGGVDKRYWAITRNRPPKDEDELTGWITSNERNNKSYVSTEPKPGAKEVRLRYKVIGQSDRYYLLEVQLLTGRKHQIRAQLASIGCPIKGDLKYGDKRSNPDGSISLIAKHIEFTQPISKQRVSLDVPVPDDTLWQALAATVKP
ncbi:MAG: RNA pseudouridine synthase [Bacteroidales bacterium]|nr:RNA pseudouridine synthase [Bacteroidales bacterium]MCD8393504.1 RNA pseudouridine synthase [Bacteroidales bacterium]